MEVWELLQIAKKQLAVDLNCDIEAFDKEGISYYPARDLPGRRPFPRQNPHFEMATFGKGIVVAAADEILPYLQEALEGKSRDEAFSMPFVYGQTMCFLPALHKKMPGDFPEDLEFQWLEGREIAQLYGTPGLDNAITYEPDPPRPDTLALAARDRKTGKLAGVAGCSDDCERMWQVGIDVVPAFRGRGLATILVERLTQEILERDYAPYYSTSTSNIFSQRTAARAGYFLAWTTSYQGRFEGIVSNG